MTDGSALRDIVERRLDADRSISADAGLLVLAALDGTLPAALRGEPGPAAHETPGAAGEEAAAAYLASLTVEGFRGIGPRAVLSFAPGPGLTLVVGRNGSGKSSFAEALELLLTGTSQRWEGRAVEWRDGWRNLHHEGPASIEAVFAIEGVSVPATVARRWPPGTRSLDDHEVYVQARGRPRTGIEALGWGRALVTHRPFLSHNELGALFEQGPTARFDAMSSLLGLELIATARNALRDERLARERIARQANETLTRELLPDLAALHNDRAARCAAALTRRPWDLDAVELILEGVMQDEGDAPLDVLRRLLAVEIPPREAVDGAVALLREAAAGLERVAGTEPERARLLAGVLERALAAHDRHGDQPCPVCGARVLDAAWHGEAERQLEALRTEAREAKEADDRADAAVREAMGLLAGIPPVLAQGEAVGVATEDLGRAWEAWTLLPERRREDGRAPGLLRFAGHLERAYPPLDRALQALRAAAAAELERREDAWRPLAARLRRWLPTARAAQDGERQQPHIRTAERWLGEAEEELRAERFRPIAGRATAIWEVLRQNSNVSLEQLALTGAHTRRRLELAVTVDGVPGAALGVMSQGELNALALSLFLPRATMPESPFRFIVIDDPVQAMDPSKVDGLACVLHDVARDRQVAVFTHDDRLPEAVRRLGIPARIIEVTRRPDSVVECREALDPVGRYLDDARALLHTDELPDDIASRVVPGFCRLALEAACTEAVRRRRIGRGEPHAEVEQRLLDATSLVEKLGLLFFDEPGHGGEAIARAGHRWGPWAGDAIGMCNRGAHHGVARVRLEALVRDTARLAGELRGYA